MAEQTLLTGYKVLDFTHALAGPTTTRLMAEMGAEVIKVEQAPYSDPARLTPVIQHNRSAYFVQHNLGKQGMCVNLKTDAGREIIRALVPHMDVVVENYSPGVMGRPELYQDPRFRTMADRAQHRVALTAEIESWLQSLPDRDTALAALEREHVPVAPVLTIPEVMQQPHFLERGAVRSVSDRVFGTLRLPGFPFRFSANRESRLLIAPDLGEHNETVLTQYLGYDADRVAHLTATGVLVFQRSGE